MQKIKRRLKFFGGATGHNNPGVLAFGSKIYNFVTSSHMEQVIGILEIRH